MPEPQLFVTPATEQKQAFIDRKTALKQLFDEALEKLKRQGIDKLPTVEAIMMPHPQEPTVDLFQLSQGGHIVSEFRPVGFMQLTVKGMGKVDVVVYRVEKVGGYIALDHEVGFGYYNGQFVDKSKQSVVCVTMQGRVFFDQLLPDERFADPQVLKRLEKLEAQPALIEALLNA